MRPRYRPYGMMIDRKKQTGEDPPSPSWEKDSPPGEDPDDLLADLIADLPLDSGPEADQEEARDEAELEPIPGPESPNDEFSPGPVQEETTASSNLVRAMAKAGKLPDSLKAPVPDRLLRSHLARELRHTVFPDQEQEPSRPHRPKDYTPPAEPAREKESPVLGFKAAAPTGIQREKKGPRLFMAEPGRHPAMEDNLKGCLAGLEARQRKYGHKLFLFTGPDPGSGVSTVVSNLALVMARELPKSNILLVDANISRPSLHLAFRRPARPGLMDILTQTLKLEDAIHSSGLANLQVLTCGDMARHVVAPFEQEVMDRLLGQVRFYYDFVLIDAAPYPEGDDTRALAPKADGTVLIVGNGVQSDDRTGQDLTRAMQQDGVKVLGTFFIELNS